MKTFKLCKTCGRHVYIMYRHQCGRCLDKISKYDNNLPRCKTCGDPIRTVNSRDICEDCKATMTRSWPQNQIFRQKLKFFLTHCDIRELRDIERQENTLIRPE